MKKTVIASVIACAFHSALAEDISTYDMGTLVVTATRTPMPLREQLNDISVITAADIAAAGQTTLPELLSTQPGIQFTQNGGMGTSSSVFIRGANSTHTLVLVDGMRINSATTGTTALEQIPLDQIDHIEILRGPGSTLYGSEAIGGVIQIFTKSGNTTPGFHVGGGVGSYGLMEANAGAHGKLGAVGLNFEVSHQGTDSFSATNSNNSYYNPDKDPYRNTSLNGKLSYSVTPDHELSASAFYSDGLVHYDGYPATFDSRSRETLSRYAIQSQDRFLAAWQSVLRVGTSADDLHIAATNGSWGQIRTDQNQIQWQNDITTRMGIFILGTERVKQHLTSNTAYTVKQRDIQSYFTGYQGKFGAHALQLNLRDDRNSQYGSHVTKSLAYGYQITPEWRTTASIGTAFRAPTFNELYYPGFGNANLKPETALNKEVSVHYDHGAHHVSWVHFQNLINDLITYPAPTYVVSQIQRARISGNTLDYHGRLGDYTIRANLTHQNAVDADSGLQLNRRARNYGTLGMERRFSQGDLGAEIVTSAKRYDDVANTRIMGGYALLNLTAGYRYSKELSLVARFNNVLDKQYELAQTYNTPGRNVYFGFDYHPK